MSSDTDADDAARTLEVPCIMQEGGSSAGEPYVDVNALCLYWPMASLQIMFKGLHCALGGTAWRCSPWVWVLGTDGVSYSSLLPALSIYLPLVLVALVKLLRLSRRKYVNLLNLHQRVSFTPLCTGELHHSLLLVCEWLWLFIFLLWLLKTRNVKQKELAIVVTNWLVSWIRDAEDGGLNSHRCPQIVFVIHSTSLSQLYVWRGGNLTKP